MSGETIKQASITIREGTTRYVNITCKDDEGKAFDFDGYEVRTHLSFGANHRYISTVVVDNVLSYKIPADISLRARSGIAETRIFKNGDVFEVLRINVTVVKADKPDVVPSVL